MGAVTLSTLAGTPNVVADTDVLSFWFRGDTRAALYQPHLAGRVVACSFMTVAELERWALLHGWGAARRAQLAQFLHPFTTVHSNEDLCRWWAAAMTSAQLAGRRIEVADAWHAAVALLYGVPLVTHNPADYMGVSGLTVITESP